MEASHYHAEDGVYVCGLCPHGCRIPVGGFGRCGTRRGEERMLVAYTYGRVSSMATDPIEKKPLYHYYPKSKIFSVGGIGCNLSCKNCQNYSVSMSPSGKKRTTYESPEEIVAMCRTERLDSIAFTYNEPTVWFEYIMDAAAYDRDIRYVAVTNGVISEEPLKELCRVTDAMNIDVKGFTDKFYRDVCGGRLADVLRSAEIVHERKVHLELTYLVIPGYNDSEEEIAGFCHWVRDCISADTPVHFTRFHPDYEMMDVPMTPVDTLLLCKEAAEESGIEFAYIGNALTDDGSDTYCPECGGLVIRRTGYAVDLVALDGRRCAYCKHRLNIIR
ncbi:MAG: AmmeMemoRadiSam system radical SAM enzyme [Candidatus Methanoplasma sp.]|nr:AmmeMemoRadiSam system radical SAM enzyme [Candidatus Methanoplasma sp.]